MIECVPNFSEGRRREVAEALAEAARRAGARVLDLETDADHNRAVLTFVAEADAAAEAVLAAARLAVEKIDLNHHQGTHPRMGAMDVCPFVPLTGHTMDDCIALARRVGERIGRELSVPVFLYERAATRPERRNLSHVREGQFEGLREAIGKDPARDPDFGPHRIHPTAGATAVGARIALIAYNIDLETEDLSLAKKIAKTVREKDGGLPGIKALGMFLTDRKCAQVSMNVCDYRSTSLRTVFDRVTELAGKKGVAVRSSEIVGLTPAEALPDAWIGPLKLTGFDGARQIIERRV